MGRRFRRGELRRMKAEGRGGGGISCHEGLFRWSSCRRWHVSPKLLQPSHRGLMSRRGGIIAVICALITGAARVALADGGAGAPEREGPPGPLRLSASAYTLAADRLTPTSARQPGLACSPCHTHFPELTATGRAFKLNGYVFRRSESLEGKNQIGRASCRERV